MAAQGRKVRAAQVRVVVRVWPVAAQVRVARRLLCHEPVSEHCCFKIFPAAGGFWGKLPCSCRNLKPFLFKIYRVLQGDEL